MTKQTSQGVVPLFRWVKDWRTITTPCSYSMRSVFSEKISPWNKDAGSKAARQWIKTLAPFAFLPTIGRFIPLTSVEFEAKTTNVDCKRDFFSCFLFHALDLQQPDLRVASFANRSLSEAIGIRLSLLFFVSFSAFFWTHRHPLSVPNTPCTIHSADSSGWTLSKTNNSRP